MTDEQQRKVPADLRAGLHPEREAGPATVPSAPDADQATRTGRPEFADVRQDGAYAGSTGAGVPRRSPSDAAVEASTTSPGAGDRFPVSRAAEHLGVALAACDVEAAVAQAAPELRDRLRAQIRELRVGAGMSAVTVVRTRAAEGGWTVWLQFRGHGDGTTIATQWDEAADGPVLRDLTVAGDGA